MIIFAALLLALCLWACIGEAYYEKDLPRNTLKFLVIAIVLFFCSISIFCQGAYFSSNAMTASRTVAPGQSAPVLTVPYALITVCSIPAMPASSTCTNTVNVYSDVAMTQPVAQPLRADAQGFFAFYIPQGYYAFSIQNTAGNFLGTYGFSIAGAGAIGPAGPAGTVTATGVNGSFNVPGDLTVGGSSPAYQPLFHIAGDSYKCRIQASSPLGCRGQNIGGFGTTTDANSISGRLASTLGFTLATIDNLAGGGGEAADVAGPQVAATYTPAVNQRWVIGIGLNDANYRGTGTHEATTRLFRNFAITRAASQPGSYISATACTVTSGTSTVDNTYTALPGVHFTGAGAMTCAITTPNIVARIMYLKKDGSTGSFTYSVSGATTGSPVTATTAATDTINTDIGHVTQAPAAQRDGLGLNAGVNYINILVSSDSTIYGVAWPPATKTPKEVFVEGVPVTPNGTAATTTAYDTDAYTDAMQFISDGWNNVQFVPIRSVMVSEPAYFLDGTHPLDYLAGNIASMDAEYIAGGTSACRMPTISDSTGGWPCQLYMQSLSATGNGPRFTMRNESQGGGQVNEGLSGPADTFTDGVGCRYWLMFQAPGGLHTELCPTFAAFFRPLFANQGVKGQQGGPTLAGSVGYAAGNVLSFSLGNTDANSGFYGGDVTAYNRRIYTYQGNYATTGAYAPDIHLFVLGGIGGVHGIAVNPGDVRSTTTLADTGFTRTSAGVWSAGNGTDGDASGGVKATTFLTPSGTGFTGSKTAGSCVLTISGGIITNVTGC